MSYPRPGVFSSHARDRLPSIRQMVASVRESIERSDGMDYQTKIALRWASVSKSVGEKLIEWLDKNHADWRNEEPSLIVEWVLREAIGWHQYDELDAETIEKAEGLIMETYLGA